MRIDPAVISAVREKSITSFSVFNRNSDIWCYWGGLRDPGAMRAKWGPPPDEYPGQWPDIRPCRERQGLWGGVLHHNLLPDRQREHPFRAYVDAVMGWTEYKGLGVAPQNLPEL